MKNLSRGAESQSHRDECVKDRERAKALENFQAPPSARNCVYTQKDEEFKRRERLMLRGNECNLKFSGADEG